MFQKKIITVAAVAFFMVFCPLLTRAEEITLDPETNTDSWPDVIVIANEEPETKTEGDAVTEINDTNNTYVGFIVPGYFRSETTGIVFRMLPSHGTGTGVDLSMIRTGDKQLLLPIGVQCYLGWPVLKIYGGLDIIPIYKPFYWSSQCYVKLGLQGDVGPLGFFIQSRIFMSDELDGSPGNPSIYYEPKWEAGIVIRIR